MKKFTTLFILIAIIISSFAITTFAVENEIIGDNVALVTIETMRITGCAPQTESVTFNTTSDTISHMDYAAIGCMECPEGLVGWSDDYSDEYAYNPKGVYADKYFVWSCWTQHKEDHGHAYYDIDIND